MGSESGSRFPGFLIFMFIWLRFSAPSEAHEFRVGGKDGWVTKPSEDYNHWAQRIRFQVNDTLYFKYKKGSDSVFVVKEEDYDSCNTKSPLQKMEDGQSSFILNRSGPFYFISGKSEHCLRGQKLIVVVMAVRHKPHSPPTPAPATPPTVAPSPEADMRKAGSPSPSRSASSGPGLGLGGSILMGLAFGVGIGMNLIFRSIDGLI